MESHRCGQLNLKHMPPSAAGGKSHVDASGVLYMQPLIIFTALATVSFRKEQEPGPIRDIQTRCPIVMASTINFDPPIYRTHAPTEAVAKLIISLKSGFLGALIAKLDVSLTGAEPLHSSPAYHPQHAKRYLQFRWLPIDPNFQQAPKEIMILTKSTLVRRTHYGTSRLMDRRGLNVRTLDPYDARVRTENTNLGKHKHRIARLGIQDIAAGSPFSTPAAFLLPIESREVILPSFTTNYALVEDTLRVQLKIQGFRHDVAVLQSPIQVNQCFVVSRSRMLSAQQQNLLDQVNELHMS